MVRIAKVPDDPAMPHLSIATDKEAMKDLFQHALLGYAEGRFVIGYLKLLQFRHETGKSIRICYFLKVTDNETGCSGEQIFYGEITANGAAMPANETTQATPRFGPGFYHLNDIGMTLWGFPNDPQLHNLYQIADDSKLMNTIGRACSSRRHDYLRKSRLIKTQTLKYVPRDRCTFRHILRADDGREFILYSKCRNPQVDGHAIFHQIESLFAVRARLNGLLIPEPIAFDKITNTFFVAGLRGKNLDECLDEVDLDAIARQAAAGLAGLHQCDLENLSLLTPGYIVKKLNMANALVLDSEPGLADECDRIVSSLLAQVTGITSLPAATIHSAFRLSQLLVSEGGLALVDLDGLISGTPIYDVGSFVAHLLYLTVREKITVAQSRIAIRAFCQTYEQHAPWGLPADSLIWFTVAELLVKHLRKYIRLSKKRRAEKVIQILNLAGDVLDGRVVLL